MPIPKDRADLQASFDGAVAKLQGTLDAVTEDRATLPCVDAWTIHDVIAVRTWWTEAVGAWIDAGRADPVVELDLPHAEFTWQQTPALNQGIVDRRKRSGCSFRDTREILNAGMQRVQGHIDAMTDTELFDVGQYAWAGKWPIARWISVNTIRQYQTARTHLRRALK